MYRRLLTLTLSTFGAMALVSCGDSSSIPDPVVSSISVSGNTSLAAGTTAQLTATAFYTNATSENVTTQSTWTSSNAAVATVSGAGVVSALTPGTATIAATFKNTPGSATVAVTSNVLAQFTVTPDAGTSAGAGQCQISQDGSFSRNKLRCTLDAGASTTSPATTTYTWEIPSGSANTFFGVILNGPVVPCGTFAGALIWPVRISVTSPEGNDTKTQNVTFVKVGEC